MYTDPRTGKRSLHVNQKVLTPGNALRQPLTRFRRCTEGHLVVAHVIAKDKVGPRDGEQSFCDSIAPISWRNPYPGDSAPTNLNYYKFYETDRNVELPTSPDKSPSCSNRSTPEDPRS